jgi:hypothetical protein
LSVERLSPAVSLMSRLARLFREPITDDRAGECGATVATDDGDRPTGDRGGGRGRRESDEPVRGESTVEDERPGTDGIGDAVGERDDPTGGDSDTDADDAATNVETVTDAVAVVVQSPPAGVRRFELTVRADAAIAGVDPDLLTMHFETFDDGPGVVRARAVDVEGRGREIEAAAPLFVVRFERPVDPDTVALDGSLDGHDEEPVPWSRVRLTPLE